MDCESFARLSNEWKGKCCIFGAGNCGSTWGYEIVKEAGFDIVCYIDNYRKGGNCNDYPIFGLDYLKQHRDLLCFVAIIGDKNIEVLNQLRDIGIENNFILPDKEEFLAEFAQYLDEAKDEELTKRYHRLMDDKEYLIRRFKERMGYAPDIDHPKSFNEKLQWLKLYDRRPLYTVLVDKFAVKEYVRDRIGEEHVIPTLGIYESFDEIDFDKFPNRFVLKCTHDSGSIVRCKCKDTFDKESAKEKLEKALSLNYYWPDREWPYYNVPRRIIAEEYLESRSDILEIYKMLNFLGRPELKQKIQDDKTVRVSIDCADINRNNYPRNIQHLTKSRNFNEIIKIAQTLTKEYPYIRLDLYVNQGIIILFEFTLLMVSAAPKLHLDNWDEILGDLTELPVHGEYAIDLGVCIGWIHEEVDLYDYKVFTFNGIPHMIQVDFDRWNEHKRNLFTRDWELMDASLEFPNDLERDIPRPFCLDEMLDYSAILTRGIPQCRCDFYISGDRLYFGELTLSHGSGCERFKPKELDMRLGDLIDLGLLYE